MNKASVNIYVQILMWTNALWNGLSGSIDLSALLYSTWNLWHGFQDNYFAVRGKRKVAEISHVLSFDSNSTDIAHITTCPHWSEFGDMAGNFKEIWKVKFFFFFCLGLMCQTRNSYYGRRRKKIKIEIHYNLCHSIVISPQLLRINKFLVTVNMYRVTFT